MPKKEIDDFTFYLLAETPKAIKVSETQDVVDAFWLPISQIEYEIRGDGTVEVTMPIWLAREKKVAGY